MFGMLEIYVFIYLLPDDQFIYGRGFFLLEIIFSRAFFFFDWIIIEKNLTKKKIFVSGWGGPVYIFLMNSFSHVKKKKNRNFSFMNLIRYEGLLCAWVRIFFIS